MTRLKLLAAGLLATLPLHPIAAATTEVYSVIVGGRNVGHLTADTDGPTTRIVYDYKNNGRGPTMAETLTTGNDGLPTAWTITGATTFGSKVNESFAQEGRTARWADSTGTGTRQVTEPSLYVGQSASPWSLGLYARALLKDADGVMPALPGGSLRLTKGESFTASGAGGPVRANVYTLTGNQLNPDHFLLDEQGRFFATIDGRGVVVRKGYEGEDKRLRELADKLSAARYAEIQKATAHRFDAPLRIRNVRLFDSKAGSLTDLKSVLVYRNRISAVEPADSPATPGEVTIDGAGGTLVPGMFEMHAHASEDDAVLNLAAGVTTMRDMGNHNEELQAMIDRIERGETAGSRIVKSGFIEGRSPFSSNNGIVVENEAQAVDAVRWYAARGFPAIKIYNSMKGEWVPPVVAEAHRLGLHVMGHVPAFSTADEMMAAGYDEMTHINQFVLQWVLKPGEDTRNLLRLTALKRLKDLDLDSAPVQRSLDIITSRKIAIDPTMGIHEALTQNRDGEVPPGAIDYIDHMPIGTQRDMKQAWIDTSEPGDDTAYRAAWDKLVQVLKMMHDRGVFIVPGTDTGGAFTFHRELELYQKIGMTPAQLLKRATLDSAAYMGMDQQLGSIENNKLADFFLVPGDPTKDLKAIKTIAMVVKDGAVYFPSEIYPHFGIKPFVAAPKVSMPAAAK